MNTTAIQQDHGLLAAIQPAVDSWIKLPEKIWVSTRLLELRPHIKPV